MITFDKQMNPGIFGGSKQKFNVDLIQRAQEKEHHIPGGYFPAVMERPYLERDFDKYRKAYTWNPDPQRMQFTKDAFNHIFMHQMRAETMSFESAIDAMELSASPGFPWNQKYKTKRDVLKPFSEGGQLELVKEIVQQVLDRGEIDYQFNGERYTEVFWLTSPKEEIRPIEKINHEDISKRKTRTFMCGDLITHIIGFMLYKNQNDEMIKNNHADSWMAIGLNPFYGGWHNLSESLLRNQAKEFYCADASHMEASVNKCIQTIVYDARNESLINRPAVSGYTDVELKRAAKWYLEQVSDSLIIGIDGKLCMKFGKNPSGQINTLTDNTLALILVILYAVSEWVSEYIEIVIAYFEIALKAFGDDSIAEKHALLRNLFQAAEDLGFKLELETVPGPLKDCTFLSSSFHYLKERHKWIQKPNFEKLFSNIFYNFKKSSWRYAYVKLAAARKLVYAFPEQREQIDDYLSYVIHHHHGDLVNEEHIDCDLTFKATVSQLMPNAQNDFLIFGDESVSELSETYAKVVGKFKQI
nr:RNA-dependent RNA polymerase [Flumine Astrovirus 4]